MLSFSFDTSVERLQLLAIGSLAFGLFLDDAGTSVAALGLVGTVFGNRDLITLFLILMPLSILRDLVWVFGGHGVMATIVAIVLLVLKCGGLWFGYDMWASTEPGAAGEADYQPFRSSPSPRARDPFDRFARTSMPPQQQPVFVQQQPLPTPQQQQPHFAHPPPTAVPPVQPTQAQGQDQLL